MTAFQFPEPYAIIINNPLCFENLLRHFFPIPFRQRKVEQKISSLREGERTLLTVESLFFGKKRDIFHGKIADFFLFLFTVRHCLCYNSLVWKI